MSDEDKDRQFEISGLRLVGNQIIIILEFAISISLTCRTNAYVLPCLVHHTVYIKFNQSSAPT